MTGISQEAGLPPATRVGAVSAHRGRSRQPLLKKERFRGIPKGCPKTAFERFLQWGENEPEPSLSQKGSRIERGGARLVFSHTNCADFGIAECRQRADCVL